jgi:vacuolar protein sorting-associated protein VTA1
MADEVPLALKQADVNISKTATRAAQLQTVKPIVSYWCMSGQESQEAL